MTGPVPLAPGTFWKLESLASWPQAYWTDQAPTSPACGAAARPRIARPDAGTRPTLIGENQSGASSCASGGMQVRRVPQRQPAGIGWPGLNWIRAIAAAMLTRP